MIASNRAFVAALIGAVVLQLGCSDSLPLPANVSITDSAGVVVVEVGSLEATAAASLSLDTLFSTKRTGVELFRVSAARLLEDGHVAVGNAGNQEILLLDQSGALQRTVGRGGDGPGEFREITTLHRSEGGGFSAYDTRLGRWTHFDQHGEVVSTATMTPPSSFIDLAPLAVGPESRVLAIYGAIRRFPGGGIQRDTTPLLRYSAPHATPDTLSLWAVRESNYERGDDSWSQTLVGFGRSLASFGTGEWAVLGDTDRLDVSLLDVTGLLVMRIQGGGEPLATADADGEQWRRDLVSGVGSGLPEELREGFVERFRQAPFRETYPAFDKVAVDTMRRVWIGATAPFGADTRRWVVFSPDGMPTGIAVLPANADVLDVTENNLLTLTRDDLGVEGITLYDVRGFARPGQP